MRRILAGAAFIPLVLAGCGPKASPTEAAKAEPAVPVTVAPVSTLTVPRTITANGTLHAYEDVMLAPKVDGRVVAVHADVGDVVVPGTLILELDPVDYDLAVNESKRALDAELARIGLGDLPPGEFDVEEVPLVQRAEASRVNAIRTFDRLKNSGSVSRTELDAAETEVKVGEANKRDAVTTAKATLASARWRKAVLDQARQRRAECDLRVPEPAGWGAWAALVGPSGAPGRFVVAQKMVSVGERVQSMPLTNAFRLVIPFYLKLQVTVPERYISEVKVGQDSLARVDAFPDSPFAAKVYRVSPTIDPVSRAFPVVVAVPNMEGKLKPGGFARASIQVGTQTIATVPSQAVITFAGTSKVFAVVDGKAKAVPVTLGVTEKEWVEVVGDLKTDTQVITSGFSQVVDGGSVRLR
jgi:multidrug efflux pump subunit AcrA (membrane-fusion protein)